MFEKIESDMHLLSESSKIYSTQKISSNLLSLDIKKQQLRTSFFLPLTTAKIESRPTVQNTSSSVLPLGTLCQQTDRQTDEQRIILSLSNRVPLGTEP